MKFMKLNKDYQKTILMYICEYDAGVKQKLLNDKKFQNYIASYNYSVKLYNEVMKKGDFEDLEEFIDDIVYKYIIKENKNTTIK